MALTVLGQARFKVCVGFWGSLEFRPGRLAFRMGLRFLVAEFRTSGCMIYGLRGLRQLYLQHLAAESFAFSR